MWNRSVWHIWMCHMKHMNESCGKYEWVMPQYQRVMPHVLSACTPQLATDEDERERLLLFATSAPEFRDYIETGRRPLITGEREREKEKTNRTGESGRGLAFVRVYMYVGQRESICVFVCRLLNSGVCVCVCVCVYVYVSVSVSVSVSAGVDVWAFHCAAVGCSGLQWVTESWIALPL